MKKNVLGLFLEKLLLFPLWVKQIIYLRLYQDLALSLSEDFINIKEEDVFHLYVPPLTFSGKTELAERTAGYDTNVYTFLKSISDGFNMLEISMNNFWSMEEVAKYYIFCLEKDYVKIPDSIGIHGMAGFMSGKFRTGEYFKRVGKINVDQLEQTILKQKELADNGTPMKMAEVMISLGLITEKDTYSLLKIKEESANKFVLDTAIVPSNSTEVIENEKKYQDEIDKLTQQNNLLKDQLRKILSMVKKKNA